MTWRVRARRSTTWMFLTNWYVRTQRQRFGEDSAFDTLYTALVTLVRLAAPAAAAGRGDLSAA